MQHVAPHSPTGRDARILRRRMCCAFVLALAGAVATTPAHADGRYCASRDAVQFGNRAQPTTVPDQLVTFYGRGIDAQAATSTLAFSPASAAFAAQPLGSQSGPLAVDLLNLGPAALTPSAIVTNGPAAYDFAGVTANCRAGATIPAGESCRILLSFEPQGVGTRYASLVVDAPQLAALASLPISGLGVDAPVANASGMWWNSPAGSEPGWGINFAHQGDTIFATWFTFGQDGKPLWLVVAASKTAPNVYSGTLYTGTGPAFNSAAFDPALVTRTAVGVATFTFTDADNASFAYTAVRACIRGRCIPGPGRRSAPCPSMLRG